MTSGTQSFTCNTCASIFDTSELQRSHMRTPWHVYNVKRRMTQLPALTREQFDAQVQPEERSDYGKSQKDDARATVESGSEPGEDEICKKLSAFECLFCNIDSLNIEDNVKHMYVGHGLYIPQPEQLFDKEIFLGYLASIIFEYKECLYCGSKKNSAEAVQAHMKDKGHCMINLDAESELLDFWDVLDEDGDDQADTEKKPTKDIGVHISETEMRLPSGSIITSRSNTTQLRARPMLTRARIHASQARINRDQMKALTDGSEDHPQVPDNNNRPMRSQPGTADHRVAVRGEMGLVGVPEQQRRALMATEFKMKKREHIVKAAQRWAMEKVANKQKFFKPDVPGRTNG